jgi:signal transduction histidine kinase
MERKNRMRTPQAPAQAGQADQANQANDEAERRIIERQVAHLSRLVDDLLDVSRITQGKIQLEREVLDLRSIVERALELIQPLSDRRSRPIDVDVPPAPVTVTGDAVRLTQVVTNLLTGLEPKTTPGQTGAGSPLMPQRGQPGRGNQPGGGGGRGR